MRRACLTLLLTLALPAPAHANFSFLPATESLSPDALGPLAVADVNRDGNLDLLVGTYADGVEVLEGDGHGGFVRAPYGAVPGSVFAVGDINGDGWPDLVGARPGSLDIATGSPAGFQAVTEYDDISWPRAIVAEPVPGTTRDAFVVADYGSDTLTRLSWDAADGFTMTTTSLPADSGPRALATGTFSGAPGVAVAESKAGAVLIPGAGAIPLPSESVGESLVTGDFNDDDRTDVAVAGSHRVTILTAQSDGSYTPSVWPASDLLDASGALATGDFNGDGIDDLAYGIASREGPITDDIALLVSDGHGGETPTSQPGQMGSEEIAAGDFDGDGKLDLAGTFARSDNAHTDVRLNDSAPVVPGAGTLGFGKLPIGSPSAVMSTTINTIADAALQIRGVSIAGADAGDFQLSQYDCTEASLLVGGGSCTVAVRFTPSRAGTEQARVVLAERAPTQQVTIDLTGVGVGPTPIVTPEPTRTVRCGADRGKPARHVVITCRLGTPRPTTVTLMHEGHKVAHRWLLAGPHRLRFRLRGSVHGPYRLVIPLRTV